MLLLVVLETRKSALAGMPTDSVLPLFMEAGHLGPTACGALRSARLSWRLTGCHHHLRSAST